MKEGKEFLYLGFEEAKGGKILNGLPTYLPYLPPRKIWEPLDKRWRRQLIPDDLIPPNKKKAKIYGAFPSIHMQTSRKRSGEYSARVLL
jgi:hypothetical protein